MAAPNAKRAHNCTRCKRAKVDGSANVIAQISLLCRASKCHDIFYDHRGREHQHACDHHPPGHRYAISHYSPQCLSHCIPPTRGGKKEASGRRPIQCLPANTCDGSVANVIVSKPLLASEPGHRSCGIPSPTRLHYAPSGGRRPTHMTGIKGRDEKRDGTKSGTGAIYFPGSGHRFFGLPGCRWLACNCSRSTVWRSQSAWPNGRPLAMAARSAATSASVCGALTHCSQSCG